MLAPDLRQVSNYTGKETPDKYIQKITNIFESAGAIITAANNANANIFIDVQKLPVNNLYKSDNPAINLPTTFMV
ncbi:1738_t:CDS:2 [Funneliformis caledonium]|uniref:1738_t:CDS:1 n=1 Tax=Funneliformis caledonium TaxID=1117310 RepID=A0A9N9FW28_9GLOM|nr:1738_t:CDS:2 [Funneliformis caledonium]